METYNFELEDITPLPEDEIDIVVVDSVSPAVGLMRRGLTIL